MNESQSAIEPASAAETVMPEEKQTDSQPDQTDQPVNLDRDPDLLPVRMLNEYVYCPRLFHLMHVDGRWADNEYTLDGKHVHRRVDKIDHVLAPEEPEAKKKKRKKKGEEDVPVIEDPPPVTARSVSLSSEKLGLTAKLDLVSIDETFTDKDREEIRGEALPVETKRGRVPDNDQRSWEPERVQLMAQGLLLREHGYHCDHGVLYFAASKTRVTIPFDEMLEADTRRYIHEAARAAKNNRLPDPLIDSPKCQGCSLNAICLPDETLALKARREINRKRIPDNVTPNVPKNITINGVSLSVRGAAVIASAPGTHSRAETQSESQTEQQEHKQPRRLYPPRDHTMPLYVQTQGARIGKSGESITVKKKDELLTKVGLKDVSQIVLCGNVSISQQLIHLLTMNGKPIIHMSMGHRFYAITHGHGLKNAYDRAAQFAITQDSGACLPFAQALVRGKILNQRTMLRRNAKGVSVNIDRELRDLNDLAKQAGTVTRAQSLLGVEGQAAAIYFSRFAHMLRPRDFESDWAFNGRNRRPPKDPVNALLSFGYAMLTKDAAVALLAEGLDPWWGLYHKPRHGRPSLGLDLMEPFRPVIVDSAVITAINTGMVSRSDFLVGQSGCVLKDAGRIAFLKAYEAKMDQLITHPVFKYRCSWRAALVMQARLLSRWLRGDIPAYESLTVR